MERAIEVIENFARHQDRASRDGAKGGTLSRQRTEKGLLPTSCSRFRNKEREKDSLLLPPSRSFFSSLGIFDDVTTESRIYREG